MPYKRCPNGSRRNKTTKKCEPTTKSANNPPSKKAKTIKKCSKGVNMPPHRIENIVKMEKNMNETILHEKPSPEYYQKMKTFLENACFPKGTKWHEVLTFSGAYHKAYKQ